MKIGILGTGKVANILAGAWQGAGHEITLGSRNPDAKRLAFEVRSLPDCVAGADIVVNAMLGSVALGTISSLDPELFAGKTLVDVTNATTPELELTYADSSLAARLQAALPKANVVKSMNHLAMTVVTNPTSVPASTIFLSGDSPEAKAETASLVRDLGWPQESIIDLGGIDTARGPEHHIVLFFMLAGMFKDEAFNIHVVR
jgi:8-hydroxy-5-deazaflavin:NADPH oxidoreductase